MTLCVADRELRPSQPQFKTTASLAKDFMGSLAYVGQAIFAPWTLPGQPFSVNPENTEEYSDQDMYYYDEMQK